MGTWVSRRSKAPARVVVSDGCSDATDGCGEAGERVGASRSAASGSACARVPPVALCFFGCREGDTAADLVVLLLLDVDAPCGCAVPHGCSAAASGRASADGPFDHISGTQDTRLRWCGVTHLVSFWSMRCPLWLRELLWLREKSRGFGERNDLFGRHVVWSAYYWPAGLRRTRPTSLHPLSRGRPSGGRRGARRSSLTGWCGLGCAPSPRHSRPPSRAPGCGRVAAAAVVAAAANSGPNPPSPG